MSKSRIPAASRMRTTSRILTALSAAACLAAGLAAAPAAAEPRPATLGELAKKHHKYFGSATDNPEFTDAAYLKLLGSEFGQTTAGNAMKWYATEPARGVFDFTAADEVVAFAKAHHQKVRGHTLLWHNQLPAWLTDGTWTPEELRAILKNHIQTVVRHFKGQVIHWDVVNEAFNEDGTYRESLFYKTLGPGYIADALRWAHEADHQAKLYLNDYNVDWIGPKSDAYYTLIKQLKADGVPVEGFGIQGHLALQYGFPTDVQQNMQRFADLGVEVAVTELDIRMNLPATLEQLATQATWYADYVKACLAVEKCVGITIWDYTDKYSWIPSVFPGEGAALPYDENLRPKPAYHSIKEVLGG
ncbi:endo-1,4-beta-xylanase [Streptomyces sp. NBC_01353]|uniref:endo-1,4-beta-xylanase n=1 Tax=Streptomyces sp. NBC_01353 TaxID=2903835 RepID=UPI002E32B434|nr:endo-1,4-beta-xylanase [Streptomyces sp. NBC_01353]